MEAIPKDVIECAILDGQLPQCREGMEWCEQHGNCYRCAKDIHDMMGEEIRRLKAERDRALAELDKALGEREDALMSERNAAYNADFDEGFVSADDWLAQHEDAMAEHGWARLPRDADGEPIHVGDVMDSRVDYLFDGKPFTVRALVLCEDGWEVADGRFGNRYEPDSLRHHHAPTVEDVLREMADRCYADEDEPRDRDAIVAEFAAKLRLADE